MLLNILRRNTTGGDVVKLIVSKVLVLCVSMATTMLLVRYRTLEEYGTYSQLLLVINLITTIFIMGLPNSINYFLARAEAEEEKRKFLSIYYTLSTLLSLLVGLVLVLMIPLIEAYFHNPSIRTFYYFLALYPWAHIVTASIEHILVVYKKTNFLMGYRLAFSFSMFAVIFLVQWLGYGFHAYMIVFVIVNALFALAVYFISGRLAGGLVFSCDAAFVKKIFAFSIPIGLATVTGTLSAEIDKLLIGYMMNTEQLAIYTNAARELPLAIISSSVTAVLLPQMAVLLKKQKTKEALNKWHSATELALIIISFFVASVFTYAPEAMTILYSAKYLPGVAVFRVYTLNLLLRCTYFGMILNSTGETRKILVSSILSLLINAILNPVFFYIMGIIGPAVATLVAILLTMQFQLLLTSKVIKIAFGRIFPWNNTCKIILINSLFAIVFYFLKIVLPLETILGDIGESILLGIVWAIIYFAALKKRIKLKWKDLNVSY